MKIYSPKKYKQMQVAVLMSGSGTNLLKILEHEKKLINERGKSPYRVTAIFSNNSKSNAKKIGIENCITTIINDYTKWCQDNKVAEKDLEARKEYDKITVEVLNYTNIDLIVYAGYMLIATPILVNGIIGINVHPSGIENGTIKYKGANAVRDAILAKEKYLYSTTHIVREKVDAGEILMVSEGLKMEIPKDFNYKNKSLVHKIVTEHQEKLKIIGDHNILPKTIEYIANGLYKIKEGKIYFNNKEVRYCPEIYHEVCKHET